MAELSNAVTVLIARMESHPEDFEVNEGELYSARPKSKFGEMVNGLYALTDGSTTKNAFWYLNDADKQALAEAWKKYHYTKFEKRVMEKIFDDGAEERELELEMQRMKHRIAMQTAMTQGMAMHNTSYPYTVSAPMQPGQIISASNAAQNNTGNTGLLGSAGSALSGLFK